MAFNLDWLKFWEWDIFSPGNRADTLLGECEGYEHSGLCWATEADYQCAKAWYDFEMADTSKPWKSFATEWTLEKFGRSTDRESDTVILISGVCTRWGNINPGETLPTPTESGTPSTESGGGPIDWVVDTLTGDVARTLEGMMQTIRGLIDTLNGYFKNLVGGLVNGINQIASFASTIGQTIRGLIEDIGVWIDSVYQRMLATLQTTIDKVSEWLGGIINTVYDWIVRVADAIKNAVLQAIEWVGQAIKDTIAWVRQAISDVVDALKATFAPILQKIGEILSHLWDGIKQITSDIWEGVKNIVGPIAEYIAAVWRSFQEGWQNFKEWLQPIIAWLTTEIAAPDLNQSPEEMFTKLVLPIVRFQLRLSEALGSGALESEPGEGSAFTSPISGAPAGGSATGVLGI